MCVRRITVYEYERGLRYHKGRFHRVLDPGQYWYIPFWTQIIKMDVRPRVITLPGQEVLSSDGVTLKVSVAAKFEIADVHVAVNKIQDFYSALYVEIQSSLRQLIGGATIEDLLAQRNDFSAKLKEMTEQKIEAMGLRLLDVALKDIMFPGALKQIFAQVVKARQEGLAALERARGETAALRNLANAARLIEKNPSLMQLRTLQALAESSGNTLVLGMPAQATPIPIRPHEMEGSEAKDIDTSGDSE